MALPRLRQVVLAARDLAPALDAARELLGAGAPYRDPGVGHFGLANGVLSAGDAFVEVVSPTTGGTSAGRWLDRRGGAEGGDGGYMLMAEVPDAGEAEARVTALGVRVVFASRLPDVVDLHLHPRDTGGCLLALDAVHPPGSWRWGGPDWTGTAPPRDGGLVEVVVGAPDPDATAARWRTVLGLPEAQGPDLALDGQRVRFLAADDPAGQGVLEAVLALPVPAAREARVAGTRLVVRPVRP